MGKQLALLQRQFLGGRGWLAREVLSTCLPALAVPVSPQPAAGPPVQDAPRRTLTSPSCAPAPAALPSLALRLLGWRWSCIWGPGLRPGAERGDREEPPHGPSATTAAQVLQDPHQSCSPQEPGSPHSSHSSHPPCCLFSPVLIKLSERLFFFFLVPTRHSHYLQELTTPHHISISTSSQVGPGASMRFVVHGGGDI